MELLWQDGVAVIQFVPTCWDEAEKLFPLLTVFCHCGCVSSRARSKTHPCLWVPLAAFSPHPRQLSLYPTALTGLLSDTNTLPQVVKCSLPRLAKG